MTSVSTYNVHSSEGEKLLNLTTQKRPSLWRLIPVLAALALLAQFMVGVASAPHALAAGSSCRVDAHHTGSHPTIQSAVNDPSCATIDVLRGTYYENVTINRDVTIVGSGPSRTTVNGGGTGRVFTISGGTVTISQLRVTGGSADYGGGIYNTGGTLTVTNSTVSANSATDLGGGGGIYNRYPNTLTITNSTISTNAIHTVSIYYADGGGIDNQGTMTITNSTISGNSNNGSAQNGRGGGIYNQGPLTLTGNTISGNAATYGGGIYANGPITHTNNTFSGNTPDDCEGIFCF